MQWYYCLIRGENFPGEIWDEDEPYGFYTHRIVRAVNSEGAEKAALDEMRKDRSFNLPEGVELLLEPKVFFEEVSELEVKPDITDNGGATWFKMSEADFEGD